MSAEPHSAASGSGVPRFKPAAMRRYLRDGDKLRAVLLSLYGADPGFDAWFDNLMADVAALQRERVAELLRLDAHRAGRPEWVSAPDVIVYAGYADRLAHGLADIDRRLDGLHRLGVRVLHLLPFLTMRADENDGGFAVSDYGRVEPHLGTNADLNRLASGLRLRGISLMADMVLNHVADTHPWATAARAGDPDKLGYFHWLDSAEEVIACESHLAQVFPEQAPGNFTFVAEQQRWVWTTFYPYQWDLNFANPAVFREIVLAMLRLANMGIEIFRIDAASYIWKDLGTDCKDRPHAHTVLRALRLITDIAVPAVALLAEAITGKAEIERYFGDTRQSPECSLAYEPCLMAALWMSLAQGDARVVRAVMHATARRPRGSAWINYVRCHDDILWDVLRPDLAQAGVDFDSAVRAAAGTLHGTIPGGFGHGVSSQGETRPLHGTSGMTASLSGMAPEQSDADFAVALRRFTLLYAVVYLVPGLPLIHSGDEIGQCNADIDLAACECDTRWLHRPVLDDAEYARALAGEGRSAAVFAVLHHLGRLRQALLITERDFLPFRQLDGLPTGVLGLVRGGLAALCNFSPAPVTLEWPADALEAVGRCHDDTPLTLPGYGLAFLTADTVAAAHLSRLPDAQVCTAVSP